MSDKLTAEERAKKVVEELTMLHQFREMDWEKDYVERPVDEVRDAIEAVINDAVEEAKEQHDKHTLVMLHEECVKARREAVTVTRAWKNAEMSDAIAQEREECAKVADAKEEMEGRWIEVGSCARCAASAQIASASIAAAIRSRK